MTMSYRTSVEGTQIFGNNESYKEWDEFIKSQGIEIDEEGCYEGEITDVMGAVIAIEKIIEGIELSRQEEILKFRNAYKNVDEEDIDEYVIMTRPSSIFDFRRDYENYIKEKEKSPNDTFNNSITDRMKMLYDNGYAFMSLAFIKACKNKIENDRHFSVPGHFYCWKIKEGETIYVNAG